jgi:hypothetical protein
MDSTYVVATQECTFEGYRRACYVWWGDAERGADLSWVVYFDGPGGWFAFSRE